MSPNDWSDLLIPQAISPAMAAASKRALFAALGQLAEAAHAVDPVEVGERLAQREKLGSTGFGGGVAIPHAKLPRLDRVTGLFARLVRPIEFRAVDDLPVDCVFVLLSPIDAGAEHLKALARVSRRLRDQTFVAKLRGAATSDALYALFTAEDARDAA